MIEACRHCDYVGAMMSGSGKVKHNEQSINDTTIQGITPSSRLDSRHGLDLRPHVERHGPRTITRRSPSLVPILSSICWAEPIRWARKFASTAGPIR